MLKKQCREKKKEKKKRKRKKKIFGGKEVYINFSFGVKSLGTNEEKKKKKKGLVRRRHNSETSNNSGLNEDMNFKVCKGIPRYEITASVPSPCTNEKRQ